MSWTPKLGAVPGRDGVTFRVWAPESATAEVLIENKGEHPLEREDGGCFAGHVKTALPGDRYRIRVDGNGPFPDPVSRFQPDGVHEHSMVVDPARYSWRQKEWQCQDLSRLVFYELHVGTFTPEGTFAGVASRLAQLRDLGITAIELMPVADFPGDRNWGYDGVALFAPARCYGEPDDLRRLVDEAHRLGIAVFLDVVYNHFGPDGAYTAAVTKRFFSRRHQSPWGAGINLDEKDSDGVRRFFIENALHWIHEYRIDGLRLDATHALVDDSGRHFLAEMTATVRESMESAGRRAWLIAEDHRNLASMAEPESAGGWGLDGIWADDFHHVMRRRLAGDDDGYFADFRGTGDELAAVLNQGWLYTGQVAEHFGGPRGTDPSSLRPEQFVICIQNHDQVGNRAFGDRLHHAIDLAAYRAAATVLLLAPQTPLLFMGQEWAASAPFQYFTDHNEELGRLVTRGRRKEFERFRAFSDPAVRQKIPDPQAQGTFATSRLDWEEMAREPHGSVWRFYRRLLEIRSRWIAAAGADRSNCGAVALSDGTVIWHIKNAHTSQALMVIANLTGSGEAADGSGCLEDRYRWEVSLTTEDAGFAADPQTPEITLGGPVIRFRRSGAVVLNGTI